MGAVGRHGRASHSDFSGGYTWIDQPWLPPALYLTLVYLASTFGVEKLGQVLPPDAANLAQEWVHWAFKLQLQLVPVMVMGVAVCALVYSFHRAHQRTLLLDYACFKPGPELKASQEHFIEGSKNFGAFSPEAIEFQKKIMERNGLSNETYLPPCMAMKPPCVNMQLAREEAQMVLSGCVDEVFSRTGLTPKDIDILVVNCSLFNPTPSLSALIINHFKMREDILSYNLAGMGCSAGVIAIGLAQRMLRTQPNSYALVVSTENITQNWYRGSDRSMLIPNTLFRLGGAAMVLTNKPTEARRAKYELEHVVRVHLGADDTAYRCVFQKEDAEGIMGVELNKDLVKVAGKALERNLTKMGPLVLPLGEKLRFAYAHVARMLLGKQNYPAYVPDFRKAFTHFCLHAGGRGVIEGLGKQLSLSAAQVEPSFNSLYWYGNTSSASIWYALSYIEACQGLKRGDHVWQVAFGSGFKCNSAVWRALRSFGDDRHEAWGHLQGSSTAAEAARGAWWRYLQERGSPGSYGREHETPVCKTKPTSQEPGKCSVQAGSASPAQSPGLNGTRSQPQNGLCH